MKFGLRVPSVRKRLVARTSWRPVVRRSLGLKAPRDAVVWCPWKLGAADGGRHVRALTTAGGDQCEVHLTRIESTNQESSIDQELRFSEFAREVVRSLRRSQHSRRQHIIGLKHVIVSYIFPYIIDGTRSCFQSTIRRRFKPAQVNFLSEDARSFWA